MHAAGVIMSSEPLIDLIPIMRREQDGQIITQFDYPSCETLGLVKMDFLGLRNLTILDDALANVETNRGERDRPRRAEQDPRRPGRPTSCSAAATPSGVFQFDGGAMRALLRLMQPGQLRGHLGRRSRSTARARWAPTRHTNYALRKNEQQEVTYHPPRARRGARADPRHDATA